MQDIIDLGSITDEEGGKMKHQVQVLFTEFVTHDVKRLIVSKPENYKFIPGQATLMFVDKPGWTEKGRPFTFTSFNDDSIIEFIIKIYPEHQGVTNQISQLKSGDHVYLEDPFGTIHYKGKGGFIAAGAGITPFIAILRQLQKEHQIQGNRLIFSNKIAKDVILEKEIQEMFSKEDDLILTLTREKKQGYYGERIDQNFLKSHVNDFSQYFYVCGPKKFVSSVMEILQGLGAKPEAVVIEG